jgi:hypothetical protein
MDSIWEDCKGYFQNEDTRRHLKDYVISPLSEIVYSEIYFYIWLICFYHMVLILLLCIILVIIVRRQSTNIL